MVSTPFEKSVVRETGSRSQRFRRHPEYSPKSHVDAGGIAWIRASAAAAHDIANPEVEPKP